MSVCFYLVLVSVVGEVTLMDVDVHDLDRKMVQVLGNPKMRLVGSDDFGGKLFVPPRGTIANMMLTAFINKYHGGLG